MSMRSFTILLVALMSLSLPATAQEQHLKKLIALINADQTFSSFHGEELEAKRAKNFLGTTYYYEPTAGFEQASELCKYKDEKANFGATGQTWEYQVSLRMKGEKSQRELFNLLVDDLKKNKAGWDFEADTYRPFTTAPEGGRAVFHHKRGDLQDNVTITTGSGYTVAVFILKENPNKAK
jgi:hypothetical protein